MKKEKGLILVGLLLAIAVLLANIVLPVMAEEAYDFDCREVVKYSHCCAPQCDNPTVITQGYDSNGKIIMTMTTNADDLWFYPSELGTIGCCLQQHGAAEEAVREEITEYRKERKVTADFYVYGKGYYPCTINRATGEISITLTGNDVPLLGSWVALRFFNVWTDAYDNTVYVVLPGTQLNGWKVPGYGDPIPLTVLLLYC